MPVRSLSSSVLKWPNAKAVDSAVRTWARAIARHRKGVLRIGYFGSYARGDWGVGSDVDLIVVVGQSGRSIERRSIGWDTSKLPVPADVLVYTQNEWQSLPRDTRFGKMLKTETQWVYECEAAGP